MIGVETHTPNFKPTPMLLCLIFNINVETCYEYIYSLIRAVLQKKERRFIMKLLDVRNYIADEKRVVDVEEYVNKLKLALSAIAHISVSSIKSVYEIMDILEKFEVEPQFHTWFYYEKVIKTLEGKRTVETKRFFSKKSGFFKLFLAKRLLARTPYRKGMENEEQFIKALRFFGLLSKRIVTITEQVIKSALLPDELYKSLKLTGDIETPFSDSESDRFLNFLLKRKTMADYFPSAVRSLKFNVSDRGNYRNDYLFCKGFNIDLSKDKKISIFVPLQELGEIRIMNNTLKRRNFASEYERNRDNGYLFNALKRKISKVLSFAKAYYVSEEVRLTLQTLLQIELLSLFYGKQRFYFPKEEVELLEKMGFNHLQIKEDAADYEALVPLYDLLEKDITPFERKVAHHTCHFIENVEPINGGDIHLRFGSKGYDKHRSFPLSASFTRRFDSSGLNSSGESVVVYMDNDRTPLFTRIPYWEFNEKPYRNMASPHMVSTAMEWKSNDKPLLITEKEHVLPSKNMFFLVSDVVDTFGQSTHEGQVLISREVARKEGVMRGDKIAFNSFFKGMSSIMNDTLFFVKDGEKIYLNAISAGPVFKRKVKALIYEGIHSMDKFLRNDLETEVVKFGQKPPSLDEPLIEVFKEKDGKPVSIGLHAVLLLRTFKIRKSESSFDDGEVFAKKNKVGSEFLLRNGFISAINGGNFINEFLLGDERAQEKKLDAILKKDSDKLFGKHGKIFQELYIAKKAAIFSTAFGNTFIPENEAHIYVPDCDVEALVKTLNRVVDITLEEFKGYLDSGKPFDISALGLRNPSIDDANGIYRKARFFKADEFSAHTYAEINPYVWVRQGGDFDGDLIIFILFPERFKKQLIRDYGPQRFKYSKDFEYLVRDHYFPGLDLQDKSHLIEACEVSPGSTYRDWLQKTGEIYGQEFEADHVVDLETMRLKGAVSLMATRISQQLIGVAKNITMRSLEFIDDIVKEFGIQDTKLFEDVLKVLNETNSELVQFVIDIKKHTDDLDKIIKTTMLVYRLNTLLSFKVEGLYYPMQRTFHVFKDLALKAKVCHEYRFKDDGRLFIVDGYDPNKDYNLGFMEEAFHFAAKNWSHKIQETRERYTERGLETTTYYKYMFKFTSYWDMIGLEPVAFVRRILDTIDINGEEYRKIASSINEETKDLNFKSLFYTPKTK